MEKSDTSFFVGDLADVLFKAKYWKKKLPRVRVFYAVKSNSDPVLLKFLTAIGYGFDCASKGEIEDVLRAGANPCDIIYANPVKSVSHLRYAKAVAVDLMTFDSESELHKIKQVFPSARLVIRIKTPEVPCGFPLSEKFGCDMEDVRPLLKLARSLNLAVVGVSFHVGSQLEQPDAFVKAIRLGREVVYTAEEVGYHFEILDIGGGFHGASGTLHTFDEMVFHTNQALDECFPEGCGMQIIAEPGYYVTTSAYVLCTKIIGKKVKKINQNGHLRKFCHYHMNEGHSLSFTFLLIPDFHRTGFGMAPLLSPSEAARRERAPCKLWGVTCSNLDCILGEGVEAPEMEEGEHFVFFNMGSYSRCLANRFNGFDAPKVFHVFSELGWYETEGDLPLKDFLKDLSEEQLTAFQEIKEFVRSGKCNNV